MFFGLSLLGLMILVVCVVGGFAILMIAIKAMKVEIPPWVTQMAWIILIVFVTVVALKLLYHFVTSV